MGEVVSLSPPVPVRFEGQEGFHNAHFEKSADRILKGHTYRDLGTVCVLPTRDGKLDHRILNALDGLIRPPNHPFVLWRVAGCEVGDAYNQAIRSILSNPQLMQWNSGQGPWLFTIEADNVLPPDALLRLLADIHETPYAAVSALYWTKGEEGVPQTWGDPRAFPPSFAPQVPVPDTVQEVRGIGMGCAVWDIAQFRDGRTVQETVNGAPVWFKTWSEVVPGQGHRVGTQDLSYCDHAQKFGYRYAVDTRVRVGHMDLATGTVW